MNVSFYFLTWRFNWWFIFHTILTKLLFWMFLSATNHFSRFLKKHFFSSGRIRKKVLKTSQWKISVFSFCKDSLRKKLVKISWRKYQYYFAKTWRFLIPDAICMLSFCISTSFWAGFLHAISFFIDDDEIRFKNLSNEFLKEKLVWKKLLWILKMGFHSYCSGPCQPPEHSGFRIPVYHNQLPKANRYSHFDEDDEESKFYFGASLLWDD